MLPIKLVRSLSTDRRAQDIGMAISVTNEVAAISYLEGTPQRLHLEKMAMVSLNKTINPGPEDRWVEKSYNDYFRSKKNKGKR